MTRAESGRRPRLLRSSNHRLDAIEGVGEFAQAQESREASFAFLL
jgi:hypothetical protein